MATIPDALRRGILDSFELPDWELRQPIRPLHAASEFFDWADETAELHDERRKVGGRLLIEHLEQMFCDFRCSERPGAGELRRVMPTKHGIWKMHPVGLRIYGWCPAAHTFVAVAGALVEDTKSNPQLNNQKLADVRAFIKEHKLQGTIIRGDHRALFP